MKSSEQLKKELHEYIDSIDDDETLGMLHEEMTEYLRKDLEEEDGLTEEQELQLEEAIRQADAGELISEEEYLKSTAKWRAK